MAGAEAGLSAAGIYAQPGDPGAAAAVVAAAAAAGPGEESSDSEGEHEGPQKLIRKVSTSGQLRSKSACIQERMQFVWKEVSWEENQSSLHGHSPLVKFLYQHHVSHLG